MTPFATLLERYRQRAGLGRNELARAIDCDPSYISRLAHDQRPPPRRDVVLALTDKLCLTPDEADHFVVTAGYAPPWLVALARDAGITPWRHHV